MKFSLDFSATGFTDIVAGWEKLNLNLDEEAKNGVDSFLTEVELAMKANVVSLFTAGYEKDVLVNSISHKSAMSKDGNGANGSAGVYDMSNKTGNTEKKHPATAPMLAFFYEAGIRPHSISPGVKLAENPSESKPNGARAKGEQTPWIHPGHIPLPFLSSAFDRLVPTATDKIFKPVDVEFAKV